MDISNWELFGRLLLALTFGGLVGLERESHGRPAGFRTHILVSVGAALVMILSIYAFSSVSLGGVRTGGYDPARLAAQVVSGIGFLGAGTIMREGATVRGLTTAASLWVVAGIGMAAGAGAYFAGGVATFLVVSTLFFLSKVEKRFISSKRQLIEMEITDRPGQLGSIATVLGEHGVSIRSVEIEQNDSDRSTLGIYADFPVKIDRLSLANQLLQLDGVHSAHVSS